MKIVRSGLKRSWCKERAAERNKKKRRERGD
jgi:hypothetical protein